VCKSILVFHCLYIVCIYVCISYPSETETFSVIEWRDLQIWVWGHSRSLKMAPLDRPRTFYWLAIVTTALSCSILELLILTLNNIATLISGLKSTQGHWNWYHWKARVRLPIRLL